MLGGDILNIGNNLIRVTVTSENDNVQKIYEINAYKKTEKESDEYSKIQEESYEKAQALLKETYDIDNSYNTERTSVILTQYKSNNGIIKIGILLSILFVLIILVVLKNTKLNK